MIKLFKKLRKPNRKGFLTIALLGMIVVFAILMVSLVEFMTLNSRTVARNITSQKAFNISEAGINYYLWHLAHNPTDFKDGKTTPTTPDPQLGFGPYEHDYFDDNAIKQGTFTLWIKPQSEGSTIATIRAIGRVNNSNITRTIEAQIGSPSFASYGVVSDTMLWFGNTESANGPVHSNQGIRMDGPSSADVTSANATYVPTSQLGGNGSTSRPGVWCNTSVTTPVDCNTRAKTDWRYPVPSVDFNALSGDLCRMKKVALADYSSTASIASAANACQQTPTTRTNAYLPQTSTSGGFSLTRGYLIELNANGTYNLSQVTAENDRNATYLTALTRTLLATNVALPPSKVIFTEDNVWLRTNSTFAGRVTIASGRLAQSNSTQAVIADDVLYSTKNGSDAIGLIAEDDVLIAPYAPPATGNFNFEVDAAMISQSGNVQYPLYYRTATSTCTRGWTNNNQTFTFYGSVASRQSWTWIWSLSNPCGDAVNNGSGYNTGIRNNTSNYDYNLLYAPPPYFPITGSYNILSWHEVITSP